MGRRLSSIRSRSQRYSQINYKPGDAGRARRRGRERMDLRSEQLESQRTEPHPTMSQASQEQQEQKKYPADDAVCLSARAPCDEHSEDR